LASPKIYLTYLPTWSIWWVHCPKTDSSVGSH